MKQTSLACSRRKLIALAFACVMTIGCVKKLNTTIPLVDLHAKDKSSAFADIFCSLLDAEKQPDGSSWGKCSQWLDGAKPHLASLPVIDNTYRYLLIAGFGSDCLTGPHSTFVDSIDHLKSVHSYTAETLPVSAFGSSEFNANQIAKYLNSQFANDQRKYIVLGYSKGTADLEVALANEPGVKDKIAALVTLSGVVQGSRLLNLPHFASSERTRAAITCTAGDGGGLQSMNPDVRKKFLADHPDPLVPTYSVAAYSREQDTSKVLLPFWIDLSQYGKAEDSQMLAAEAVYPRGNYLGLLRRDHWAIAIPFEPSVLVDKTAFPRPQLFEAILRFVTSDLKSLH
ncbi:MAG TPA: hypothetical protein VGK24_20930 [Candidatus Angelobacter sp.]